MLFILFAQTFYVCLFFSLISENNESYNIRENVPKLHLDFAFLFLPLFISHTLSLSAFRFLFFIWRAIILLFMLYTISVGLGNKRSELTAISLKIINGGKIMFHWNIKKIDDNFLCFFVTWQTHIHPHYCYMCEIFAIFLFLMSRKKSFEISSGERETCSEFWMKRKWKYEFYIWFGCT